MKLEPQFLTALSLHMFEWDCFEVAPPVPPPLPQAAVKNPGERLLGWGEVLKWEVPIRNTLLDFFLQGEGAIFQGRVNRSGARKC